MSEYKSKGITGSGQEYIQYKDGSWQIDCAKCMKETKVEADSNLANALDSGSLQPKDYTCTDCYKKQKEKERKMKESDRVKDIHFGQAYNLAFEYALQYSDRDSLWETIKEVHPKVLNHMKKLRENEK